MILIVDDHADTCRLLVRLLRRNGFEARYAEGGAEALRVLRALDAKPGLIVLDYMMPGMDGIDVLRRLRADPALSGVPVVIYSAGGDRHVREEARRLGACHWLSKGDWDHTLSAIGQAYRESR